MNSSVNKLEKLLYGQEDCYSALLGWWHDRLAKGDWIEFSYDFRLFKEERLRAGMQLKDLVNAEALYQRVRLPGVIYKLPVKWFNLEEFFKTKSKIERQILLREDFPSFLFLPTEDYEINPQINEGTIFIRCINYQVNIRAEIMASVQQYPELLLDFHKQMQSLLAPESIGYLPEYLESIFQQLYPNLTLVEFLQSETRLPIAFEDVQEYFDCYNQLQLRRSVGEEQFSTKIWQPVVKAFLRQVANE